MKRLAVALLGAALAVAGAASARADGEETRRIVLRTEEHEPSTGWKEVGIRVRWGVPASGSGWGFARVILESTEEKPIDVRLWVGDDSDVAHASRTVHLGAKGRAEAWMPRLPGWGQDRLRVSVRDYPVEVFSNGDTRDSFHLLSIGDSSAPAASTDTEAIFEASRKHSPHIVRNHTSRAVLAEDIPPSWTYLTGAPLIVVHGSAPGLDVAERQRTLADYVEAGGAVLVLDGDALPKGPLADLTAPESAEAVPGSETLREGTRGFGRWTITSEHDLGYGAAAVFVATWLTEDSKKSARSITGAGMLAALSSPIRIPGLGRVNVRLFFFLLLVFAVLVGPVAYLVLKRRRRLTLMLAVVPATGILFAGGILAYGLLSEGLGTRGSVESVTFLDQRAHTATCVAGRTLFAGWGASSLRLSPDTALATPGASAENQYGYRTRNAPWQLSLDLDAGVVEDAVLPSRTVTTLATVSRARARERIRFRARTDGGYDVLTAEGFAPAVGVAAQSILLCDAMGDLYASPRAGDHLQRVSSKWGAKFLATFVEAAVKVPTGAGEDDPAFDPQDYYYVSSYLRSYRSDSDEETPDSVREAWIRRVVPEALPKSSYLAWTTRAPGFDDLGLSVEWKHARHLVFGLLAAEDFDGK